MNRDDIMEIIPHRGNMLLIDEAEVIDGKAHGKFTVRGDEWFLDGHFPGNPVVPGVILCEILAQSTCVLLSGEIESGVTPYFTGISTARFKSPVKPGDTVETECAITKKRPPFYFASGELRVDGK
ncbi:MAG: beta-hydroxyacyl-ACP dehydratase, partial [Oscillospiraceae bacterium]|nr:beta-hydroxyacyl-ACP dehydratase [Oscillospiraceae bacterium]